MLFDDTTLTGLYIAGFLPALVLPGIRSIIAAGIAGAAVFGGIVSTAGDSVASVLGVIFVLTLAAGLGCGLVTRAITLWAAPFGRRPFSFAGLAVAGFFLPPLLHAGPADTLRWITQPSLRTCEATTFPVLVAGKVFNVPPAPVLSVHLPQATRMRSTHDVVTFRHFRFQFGGPNIIDICRRTVQHGEIVGPAALSVQPWVLAGSHTDRWKARTCASPRQGLDARLCELTNEDHPARRLERATIYGSEISEQMLAAESTSEAEKKIRDWLVKGIPPDSPPPRQLGAFDVYSNGLRVARGPSWAGRSGGAFGAFCGDVSIRQGTRLCAAEGPMVEAGYRVRFTFRTSDAHFEADVGAIRAYLSDLVRDLAAPPQAR